MAAAISNASNMFLRKSATESAMPKGKSATVTNLMSKDVELPVGVKGPKYKSIEDLRQEREEVQQESNGQSLEFAEDENRFERAKPIQLPPFATYAAVAMWFILLFAVIGAFVYRLNQ